MEAKHTPGPWELDDEAGNRPQRGSGGERVWKVVRPRGGLIADVSAWWVATGTARENARLIAAAPELAEACQALIALVDGPKPVNSNTVADVHVLARAALRKAGVLA